MNTLNFFSQHLYFLAALYSLFWWIIFSFHKAINKRKMVQFSIVGIILGVLSSPLVLTDWWHPHFVFNTTIKMEDVIFSFGITGIMFAISSILKSCFKFRTKKIFSLRYKIILLLIPPIIFILSYYSGTSSFWASIIGLSACVLLFCVQEPKSISVLLCTGFLTALLFLPGYLIGIHLNPAFIRTEWWIDKLSGITLFTIPIEEFAWYFFAGMAISVFQILFDDLR